MQPTIKVYALVLALMTGLLLSAPVKAAGELKNETLTIIINPVGAPIAFLKDDLKTIHGVDADIIHELQKRLGFKLTENRIFPDAFVDGMERVRLGKADIMGGSVSYTKERTKSYDFTPIYCEASLGLMYSKKHHPNIKSLKDISNLNIGVQQGSTSEHFANLYNANTVTFNNVILAYFNVANGKMDGIIFDRPPIDDFARVMSTLDLAITNDSFGMDECKFAFALTKNSPHNKIIISTMQEMLDDGTIDAIKEKWHLR